MNAGVRRDRVALVLGSLACAAAYHFAYCVFLVPFFEYYNYTYFAHSLAALAVAYAIAAAPSLVMPVRLTRPTQMLYWLLYLMVYIPSVLTPLFISVRLTAQIWLLLAVLAAGFTGMGLVYRAPLLRLPSVHLAQRFFGWFFGILLVSGLVIAWRTYAGHLQLVNFFLGSTEVNQQRLATRDIGASAGVLQYLLDAVACAIDPMLMSYGLMARKRGAFAVGAAGQVLLYATAGMKSIILSVPLTVVLFLLMRRRSRGLPAALVWGTAGALLVSTAIGVWGGLIGFGVGSLVILRTFGTPGLLTAYYADFFATHPLTLGSHIRGLSALMQYPYHATLPYVIGLHYWNNVDLSANANFWAQDGLAGFGFPGVLLLSGLAALLFWLIDSACARLSPRFAALALAFQAVNLGNGSLFTILLTNGLALQILMLYLWPGGSWLADTDAVDAAGAGLGGPQAGGVALAAGPS